MKRSALRLATVVVLAATWARAERLGDLDVSPLPPDPGETWFGYAEHRFRVANDGARPLTVTIELLERSDGGPGVLRRTVVVGPRSAAVVALWQPSFGLRALDTFIYADGRRVGRLETAHFVPHGEFYAWRHEKPLVLTTRGIDAQALENAFQPSEPTTGGGAPEPNIRFIRAEQAIAGWSPHWLAYSRYDGVAITAEDHRAAPDGVRDALRRYAEAGGVLLILGATPLDAPDGGRLQARSAGFGVILHARESDPTNWTPDDVGLVGGKIVHYRSMIMDRQRLGLNDLPALQGAFGSGIPFRTIYLLMLLFAALIGPVNLIWAHRRRRPVQLLWTTPVIALSATAALFVWGMLSEGTTPTTRLVSLTLLDQGARRAATLGALAWYCPLTPSGGLRFSADTELEPVGERGRRGGVLDWTREQHLVSGWLPARTPTAFYARKVEPRRERIRVSRDNGGLRAVNGLGADIVELWLADEAGRIHRGERIAAGRESALRPTDVTVAAAANRSESARRFLASEEWAAGWPALTGAPTAALRPGEYLAVLDGSPFLESGLDGRQNARRRALVLGALGPEDLP